MMKPDPQGKKVGIITKPYGLLGKLNVILDPGADKNIHEGSPLFISIDGQRVPFFIEEVEHVSQNHYIIKLEFIESVDDARKVSNCDAFSDPRHQMELPDGRTIFDQLIGYSVVDQNRGHIGTITGFIAHEYNPVFMIDHMGVEIMIPANEHLIDQIDQSNQSVHYRLPDGLIDL